MKRLLLTLLMSVLMVTTWSKPVDPMTAQRVAQRYLHGDAFNVVLMNEIYLVTPVNGDGFVLISADDCVMPVLGYSSNGSFVPDMIPDHVQQWLDGYACNIKSLVEDGIVPSNEVTNEWLNHQSTSFGSSRSAVAPLLSTTWSQRPLYNNFCPYDQQMGTRCVTGCVATATAQVMKYWSYPAIGQGSHSYNSGIYGTLSVDFGSTIYQWNAMPDVLNYSCDSASIAAVATLMYHVGVSVDMEYGPDGSAATLIYEDSPSALSALRTYFNYSHLSEGLFHDDYDDDVWDEIVYHEISNGRPVIYGGVDSQVGGHAFVLDGYDGNGMFHVNWGWGGVFDGFYTIDNLSPGEDAESFNLHNHAVVGIEPIVQATEGVARVDVYGEETCGTVSGSGDYAPNQDTAFIVARAADGYRFAGWKHSYIQSNPIRFVPAGDFVDTALFVPVPVTDTVGYCEDRVLSTWHDECGSRTEWGICVPQTERLSLRRLKAVQIFIPQQDVYTLRIYRGDTISDQTLVYEEDIIQDFSNTLNQWNTFDLPTAVPLFDGETLWVTVYTIGGGSPASFSRYSGNSNGTWYKTPQGWMPGETIGLYASWMIRAVFEERPYYVAVDFETDCDNANVEGEGYYDEGDVATVAIEGGYFVDAEGNPVDGNTVSFIVTDDTVLHAVCNTSGIDVSLQEDVLHLTVIERNIMVWCDCDDMLRVFDIYGRLIAEKQHMLKVKLPSAGTYIVRVGQHRRKIIVQ